MTTIAEVFKKEFLHKKEFLENDLKSLGIEPKRENDLNGETELEALAEMIKQVYYQDYKTAYSDNSNNNNYKA
jgi:heme oxygenase